MENRTETSTKEKCKGKSTPNSLCEKDDRYSTTEIFMRFVQKQWKMDIDLVLISFQKVGRKLLQYLDNRQIENIENNNQKSLG